MRHTASVFLIPCLMLVGPQGKADDYQTISISGKYFKAVTEANGAEVTVGDFGFNVTWSMSEDGDSYFHIVRKGTRSESKTGAGFWFLAGLDKFKDERSDDFGKPKDLEDFLATLKSADSTANLGLMELLDRIDSELADWRKVGRTSGLPKEAREKREAWRPLLQFNTAVRKELARKH